MPTSTLRSARSSAATAHPHGRSLLSDIGRAGAATAVVPLVVLVAAVIALLRGRWREPLALLLACGGAVTITAVVKVVVGRDGHPRKNSLPISHTGFPSGHATLAIAVYGMFAVIVWRLTDRATHRVALRVTTVVATGSLVAAVALAQVYLGHHWLTDVAGGLLLGGAWLVAVALVSSRPPPALLRLRVRHLQEHGVRAPVVAVDTGPADHR